MRNLLLIVAVVMTGCAGSSTMTRKSASEPPKTITIAPHAQARKSQQQEEKRKELEIATRIDGGTVVK